MGTLTTSYLHYFHGKKNIPFRCFIPEDIRQRKGTFQELSSCKFAPCVTGGDYQHGNYGIKNIFHIIISFLIFKTVVGLKHMITYFLSLGNDAGMKKR